MGSQLPRSPLIRSVLPIVVLGLVLVGCSQEEPGAPQPTRGAAPESETAGRTTTATTSLGGGLLADFDPCVEMNAVAAQVGLTAIEEDGTQECKGRYAGTVSVRVKAFPELGIEDYVPGGSSEISEIALGAHKAKRVTKPASSTSCAVTVEVTTSSRVDVVASANASLDEACKAATDVAAAVEPKLPK
ncbi:hypothetical protein JOF41_005803 [Saccharothrix coeruleofusca]|uniref:hypothetical protein n=1 Tax=Saccharothrix coeruleofusca TaxID=33919 RepID=UPI001AE647B4|nr:hypothetical protein [Saccharothrix coeruleofusca]MBP2339625.1 hypothetical protein [Saccharothrix coeruleofusca]